MPFVDPIYQEKPGIEDITGLCISGGGYRATLFHLGSLWRLNETGHLRQLRRISSVSGGSITSGYLGSQWGRLRWKDGAAENFEEIIVEPVRQMARTTVDVRAVLGGFFSPFSSAGDKVAKAYDKHLFKGATLQHLPDSENGVDPRFVINATNLQSGALWRFSRRYMGDYKVGLIKAPDVPLATAVAASSAFPPVLSPLKLDLSRFTFAINEEEQFLQGGFRKTAILSDGGVYDNMGMETVWKRCRTVLVSDAGAAFSTKTYVAFDWPQHSIRVLDVIDNQVRSLRKREIMSELTNGTAHTGAYWSIRSVPSNWKPPLSATPDDVARFTEVMETVKATLPFASTRARQLAATPTRLQAMHDDQQERLINLGYLISTAALGIYCRGPLPDATIAWPYARGI